MLTALKELGGSATVKELYKKVVEDEAFTGDGSPTRGPRIPTRAVVIRAINLGQHRT